MIRFMDLDEWYPVFTLRDNKYDWDWNDEIDLSEAEIEDFERVLREFKAWQMRLDALATDAVERRKANEPAKRRQQ